MGLRDRIREAAAKRKANKANKGKINNAQARQVESIAGTNPTGGASTTANTNRFEGSKQNRPETAAMFRAKKKAELDAAKRVQVAKQKKVTKDKDTAKAAKTYKQGEQLGTKKGTTKPKSKTKEQYKSATKKSDIAKTNKVAASKVKDGETYTRTMSDGSTKKVRKRPAGYKASK